MNHGTVWLLAVLLTGCASHGARRVPCEANLVPINRHSAPQGTVSPAVPLPGERTAEPATMPEREAQHAQ